MDKIKISTLFLGLLFLATNANAMCSGEINLGTKAITTSAITFRSNELINKQYVDKQLKSRKDDVNKMQVVDHEGWIHSVVKIGTQLWMADNMYVSTYSGARLLKNGTTDIGIPIEHGEKIWSDGKYNNISYPSTSNYGSSNIEDVENSFRRVKFGNLYQWNAAVDSNDSEGARGICPKNWHIPTNNEWDILQKTLGAKIANNWDNGKKITLSTKLRVGGESGFYAILSGFHDSVSDMENNLTFKGRGIKTFFWSSTKVLNDSSTAWVRGISSKNDGIFRGTNNKAKGLSVRCIHD